MPKTIMIEITVPDILFDLFKGAGTIVNSSSVYFEFSADSDAKMFLAQNCMLAHIEQHQEDERYRAMLASKEISINQEWADKMQERWNEVWTAIRQTSRYVKRNKL